MQQTRLTSRALTLAVALLVGVPGIARAEGGERAPEVQAPSSAEAAPAAPAELPDALPPLSDDLLGLLEPEPEPEPGPSPLSGITLVGEGRLRLEVDQRSLFEPAADLYEGAALTGRVGLEGAVGPARARIVLGAGDRFGRKPPLAPLPLVEEAPLSLLREAALSFDVSALGLPLRLTLGRFPLQVADGRLIGVEDFDPLGRAFDGAVLSFASGALFARAGGLYLGPYTTDIGDTRWAAFLEAGTRVSFWRGTAYAILHRDASAAGLGLPPVTAATLGARSSLEGFGLTLSLGADGQLPFLDDAPLEAAGWGAHLEGALRYAPELSLLSTKGAPFIELSAEWTGGAPVERDPSVLTLVEPRFRLPAPSVHPFLGVLDLARADNVTSGALTVGFSTVDGLLLAAEARLIALSDPKGVLLDARGAPLPRYPSLAVQQAVAPESDAHGINEETLAFTEIDARVALPLFDGVSLEGEYGVALPGPAFGEDARGVIQRLLLSVRFTLDAPASE